MNLSRVRLPLLVAALAVALTAALVSGASGATQTTNGYTVTDTVTHDSSDPQNPTTTFSYAVTVTPSAPHGISHIDLQICPGLTAQDMTVNQNGAWVNKDGSVPSFPKPLVKWDGVEQETGTRTFEVTVKGLVQPTSSQFLIKAGQLEETFQVQGPSCEPQHGTLIIDKVTDPAGDPQEFGFSAPGVANAADQSFGLADGSAPKSISVAPGAYDVTEAALAGWNFTDATCSDSDSAQSGDRKVTANVASGETVTCTFRNAKQPTENPPPPGNTPDPFVPQQQQPPGEQQVLGDRVTPGSARLAAATGCQSRPIKVAVRGSSIRRVTFTVDGKRVKKVRTSQAGNVYSITVDPRRYSRGSHLIKATVVFTKASGTRTKTMRARFSRCVRAAQPAFTG